MGLGGNFRTACVWFSILLLAPTVMQDVSHALPSFISIPPPIVDFSNSTGGSLQCTSSYPDTKIEWLLKDDSPVTNVNGLRTVDATGKITFFPFSAEAFRQDVHATVYKCTATNTLGTIVSHDINVKAVVLQPYEVYVYDVYAIQGNTAVMRCNIPSFLRSYVNVTAWIRDSVVVINSIQIDENSKYSLMPSGELYIKAVEMKDGMTSFHCQTYNRLTGDNVRSTMSGKLFVTEPQGNVPPKITLSKKKVSVIKGQSAFLPCEVQANPSSNTSWQRTEMQGLESKTISDHAIQVCGSLIIKNVKTSDSGMYRCSSSNTVGQEYVNTELLVIEPLKVKMVPESVMINAGEPTSISCKQKGSPIPSLKWLKNGKPVLFTNNIFLNDGNDTIYITMVSADDKGIYQCCAVNDYETVCGSAAVLLGDMPPLMIETFDTMVKHPGTQIRLNCSAKGNPLPEFTWSLDGNKLQSNHQVIITQSKNDDIIVTELAIKNANTEDGGLYKCLAQNRAGRVFHWSKINVYGEIGIRQTPTLSVVNGANAILNCPVYGYPIGEIEWKKGELILPQDVRQMQHMNDSLTIHSVHRTEDSGIYICSVSINSERTLEGKVRLDVLVAPKLSPFSFQDELVQEGSRGRLQCVVVEGDTPLNIQWEKDDKAISSDFGVTVRDIDEFSSILTIAAITPRHNGKYTCRANNAAGSASFSTHLAVNVAPKITPFAFPENGLTEGVLARLSCVVYQGDLPIEINWLKNGKVISADENIVTKSIDDYSSILTIENVQKHHAGNYTCSAHNSAATISHMTKLLVNGNRLCNIVLSVPPKIVPFAFQDDHLVEGSLLRVSCVVSRGDLPLAITWLKDGKLLPDSVVVRDFDSYSTVLSIDPVKRNHTGNYTCIAENQAGIATYSAELIVQVPPKWLVKPTNQIVINGADAYFHCEADGYPIPKISWMFAKGTKGSRSQPIHSNNEIIILTNGTLILKNLSKAREGRYACIASNGVGHNLNTIVLLSVLAPPHFSVKSQKFNKNIYSNAKLICNASGDIPITFSWQLNNIPIEEGAESKFKIIQDGFNATSSTLEITQITREDSASYICKAKNSFGTDTMEAVLNVQEPPEAPVLESQLEVGNRTIFLTWIKPFDGNSLILEYLIQYKRQVDNWQLTKFNVTVDGSKTATTIVNLQPATSYIFRIGAKNEIGLSKFSNELILTTDMDIPTGMVQNVEVEAIDGNSFRITWKPPRKDTWNGIIRGYNIGYRVNGSNSPYEFSALEVPEDYTEDLIYQISNLHKYTMYTVVIQVYNDKGVGPLTEPILAMTSEDVPSQAPEGLRCSTLSSKSIYVLWESVPLETVNGILRGYKVFYKPITEWYDVEVQYKTSEKERLTLSNLDVNTNYSIAALAYTKVGDGMKTEPVYCKTHEDVPDRPNKIKVLPATSESVVVAWKPPNRINGDIIKYNIYYRPLSESEEIKEILKTEQTKTNNVHTYQSDMEYFEIKGLRKNQKYAFWVTATSAIGEGQQSDVIAQSVADNSVAATAASFDDVINTPWKRDVTLPCRAVGIPTPQHKWSIGHESVLIGGRKIQLSDGTLLINKVDSKDTGNYTCTIYNIHGKDEVKYCLNVQVPPGSPILDIISKTRSSIQLQWKPNSNGGDPIKGYILHYKRDDADWESVELSHDKEIFTLSNLACGANYQIYMEAFNKIGKGLPCDVIKTSTEGSEITIPTKEQLLHEGSTFVSVHLESWPVTACTVQTFQVEYKTLHSDRWTTVSSSIRPTQRKLVIPGLIPATWYNMRVIANTNGDAVPAEYKFATLTSTGEKIPPPEIRMESPQSPVYIFYLDPYIFIPAVALLIVVIIASVVMCVWFKRKNGSVGTPSDYGSTLDTWRSGTKASSSYPGSALYATIPHHKHNRNDPNPYATDRVDYFPDSDAWVESRTLTRIPHHSGIRVLPPHCADSMQQATNRSMSGFQETEFGFGTAEGMQSNDGYDKPPKGM